MAAGARSLKRAHRSKPMENATGKRIRELPITLDKLL